MLAKAIGALAERRCPRWVVVALCAGVALAPSVAVAASLSQARVLAPDGAAASVASTGQLSTSQVPSGSLRAFHYDRLYSGTCTPVYTAPKGTSFVLTSLTVDVFVSTFSGPGVNVRIGTSPGCADREVAEIADANPGQVGASSFTFNPGIVVTAGRHLYAVADNGSAAAVYGYGYVVASPDAQTPTVGVPGRVKTPPDASDR